MALIKIKSSTWVKINCALTGFLTILLLLNHFQEDQRVIQDIKYQEINACCGFPCQNGGVCIAEDRGYSCDCADTGYFGKNCQQVSPLQWLKNFLTFQPNSEHPITSNDYSILYKATNYFSIFQKFFNKKLYRTAINRGKANYRWTTAYDFSLIDAFMNITFTERSLPPIPKLCPVPMGIRGPKQLPSPELLYEKLFQRIHFQPCPKGTNVLFATYIQHFVSQFDQFEDSRHDQNEWGSTTIDMSNIYGKHSPTARALRTFSQGKLKCRHYKDEEYPPYLEDSSNVEMIYPEVKLFRYEYSSYNLRTKK